MSDCVCRPSCRTMEVHALSTAYDSSIGILAVLAVHKNYTYTSKSISKFQSLNVMDTQDNERCTPDPDVAPYRAALMFTLH